MRSSWLTDEVPLTNPQRLAQWRDKRAGWQLERWWELAHPDEPAIEVRRSWEGELPSLLRRQAE